MTAIRNVSATVVLANETLEVARNSNRNKGTGYCNKSFFSKAPAKACEKAPVAQQGQIAAPASSSISSSDVAPVQVQQGKAPALPVQEQLPVQQEVVQQGGKPAKKHFWNR